MDRILKLFTPAKVAAALAVIFLLFTLLPLGVRPLFFPDETRYSQIPREMLHSGNWYAPTFLGMPYYEKPAGGYVPTILSMKLFGETPFASRFPQVICTLLSAAALWFLAKKMMETEPETSDPEEQKVRRWLPTVACAVLLTMGEFMITGVYAVLDPLFVFPVTASLACFYYAWCEKKFLKKELFLLLCGVFCGLAFMVKGFLGLVLPGMTAFLFLVWKKEWKNLFTMEWAVLLAAAAVILPWAFKVHEAAPGFWERFIMDEHIGRFLNASSSGEFHKAPFWYFIPVLPLLAMPWTLYFAGAWKGFKKIPMSDGTKFLIVWVAGMFLLFSASQGKLVTYVLPLFPACALLGTRALLYDWTEGHFRIRIPSCVVAGICYFLGVIPVMLCILAYFSKTGMASLDYFMTSFTILVYLWFVAWILRKTIRLKPVIGVILTALAYLMLLPVFHKLPAAYTEKITLDQPHFMELVKQHAAVPGRKLFSHRKYAGSLAWYLNRTDIAVYGKKGEFAYGLKSAPERYYPQEKFETMLKDLKKGESIFLLLPVKEYRQDFKGKYNADKNAKGNLLMESYPEDEKKSPHHILIFTGR